MAKADSMLSILWLLLSKKQITAAELADRLEISVRTVYRYIDSLCASGVPIISESGHDGGYRLLNQFVEAPLFFNTDERKALFYAAQFAKQAGYPYEGSLENALQKIEYQMSTVQLKELESYTSRFDIVSSSSNSIDDKLLQSVEKAIFHSSQVILCYKKRDAVAIQNRKVDPYGIICWNRKWYLIGFCHLRKEKRTFRLDRLQNLEVMNTTFSHPENFSATDFFLKWLAPNRDEGKLIKLTIQGTTKAIHYLRNHWQLQYFFIQQTDNEIQFLVEKNSLEIYIPKFLITYGTTIRIVEPDFLRKSLVDLSKNLTNHYDNDMEAFSETK